MKKFVLFTLSLVMAMSLTFTSCDNDDDDDDNATVLNPTQTQYGLAINYTATWCGPCGNWGAPLIHELADMGNVVAITNHASGDPMYTAGLYGSMSDARPTGGGIPAFWIGDTKTTSTSEMTTLLAQTPIAGVDLSRSVSGSTMTVKVKAKFFAAGTGDYYLSVYVLENGIDGSAAAGNYEQNGAIQPYEHDYVLRTSALGDGDAYGELIATDPANGKTVNKEYSITLDSGWDNSLYACAIIWKKDGTFYEFVNAKKK